MMMMMCDKTSHAYKLLYALIPILGSNVLLQTAQLLCQKACPCLIQIQMK